MKRKLLSILAAIALAVASIHPPQPALADPAYLSLTGNPLTSPAAPYLILSGMVGQSACAVTVNTAGGTLAVQGHYKGASAWTGAITTTSVTDGTTNQATQTAVGSYAFNCSGMDMIRADGTAASGTPSVTLTAAGGVSKVLGRSGGGSSTTITAGPGIAVANPTPGSYTISSTYTPSPTVTPVSVQPGTNTTIGTPSPGVFVVNAVTPAPPSITGTGAATVTNPSTNTYVIAVPTAAPVTGVQSVTSGNVNNITIGGTATNPSVNLATNPTVSNETFSTLSQNSCVATTSNRDLSNNNCVNNITAGSGITETGTPQNPTIALTVPVVVANGGRGATTAVAGQCDDALSTTAFSTSNCSQWSVNTFTVPAPSATVTITANDGKLFTMPKYTPLLVTDGTNVVEGYANATVTNSATVVLFATNNLFGTSGSTMAANAFLSVSGMGTTTASSIPPTFSGGVNTGVNCVKSNTGTGGSYNLCPGYYQIVHAGGSSNVTSTMSDSSLNVTSGPDGGGDVSGLTLHATGLTSGRCVGSTTGGLLFSTASACGTGSGTVTSVTGDTNISVTNGTTTPTLAFSQNPTVTGTVTAAMTSVGTAGGNNATSATKMGSAATGNYTYTLACNTTSSCVTSTVTGGAWALTDTTSIPLITINPSGQVGFKSTTYHPQIIDLGLTANTPVVSNSLMQLTSASYFAAPTTAASFVIPALGSTVTVTTTQPVTLSLNIPVSISDGTNELSGASTTAVTNATSFTLNSATISVGAVGNTMAAGAQIVTGSNGSVKGFYINGARQPRFHVEAFNGTTITNGGTATFTFGATFNTATSYTCQNMASANTAALGGGNIYSTSRSATAITVTNSTGASQVPDITCQGY